MHIKVNFLIITSLCFINNFVVEARTEADIELHNLLKADEEKDKQLEASNNEKKDFLCISLGSKCAVSFKLRDNKLRSWAFPFDWNISSLDGLCELIENDFIDFLNPCYLSRRPGCPGVYNSKYFTALAHDFPEKDDSEKNIFDEYAGHILIVDNYLNYLPDVQHKYKRRQTRFYNACKLANFVYFFRLGSPQWDFEDSIQSKEDIIKLKNTLIKKFPENNWILVAIDSSEEYKADWEIPRVKNFYITHREANDEWKDIFKKLGLLQ